MAQYTTRTCHVCGIRKPQPEMTQASVKVNVGGSRATASGATVVGAMLGDKKSQKAIGSTVFNSGARTYHRTKKVWVCGDAACRRAVGMSGNSEGNLGGIVMIGIGILLLVFMVFLGKVFGTAEEREQKRLMERVEAAQTARADQINAAPAATSAVINEQPVAPAADMDMLREAFIALPQQDRERVQSALSERGLYNGEVDGVVGKKTLDGLAAVVILEQQRNPSLRIESQAQFSELMRRVVRNESQ